MTPKDFIAKWRNDELKERTASHSHFNDLCSLLEIEDPVTADSKGDWFTFKKGASKTTTFETFPFPEGLTPNIPAADYAADPRAVRIATAAARLNELRENWLNPADLVIRVPEVVEGYPDRILPRDDAAAKELKNAPSPTSTMPAPHGSTTRTRRWMRPWQRPTAGAMIGGVES